MTFTFNMDIGQAVLVVVIAVIGYFLKRTIDRFDLRLDKHENILFKLVGDMQRIIGIVDKRYQSK